MALRRAMAELVMVDVQRRAERTAAVVRGRLKRKKRSGTAVCDGDLAVGAAS